MIIDYTYNFLLAKEKGKNDSLLRYRVKWHGYDKEGSLGVRVENEKWSFDTQRCKLNTSHGAKKTPASRINQKITDYEKAIKDVFKEAENKDFLPNRAEFELALLSKIDPRKAEKKAPKTFQNFFDVFDAFVSEVGKDNGWDEDTYIKFQNIKNHLQAFDPELPIQITHEHLTEYLDGYLRKKKKHVNTTAAKNISFTKRVITWAAKKKIYKGDAHETFNPKFKGADIKNRPVYFTREELAKWYTYDFENDTYNRVRDLVSFLCFSGLRESDMHALEKSDLEESGMGVVTRKSVDSSFIDFNRHSLEILEKYKDTPGRKALPVMSQQKMNDYMKIMGKKIGFKTPIRVVRFIGGKRIDEVHQKWELLSTKVGRKTFIVMALLLKVPPTVVMKWTGHEDFNAMKPYMEIVDELKEAEMKKFDELLPSGVDLKNPTPKPH